VFGIVNLLGENLPASVVYISQMELASGSQRHDGSCNMISIGGTWEALSCDGRTLAGHNILYVTCKIHTYH